MAFGRKKRRQEAEEGEALGSEPGTAVEPPPAAEGTESGPSVEPPPAVEGTEADSAGPTAAGDDVAQAALLAGDPAAASTDAEAWGAEPSGAALPGPEPSGSVPTGPVPTLASLPSRDDSAPSGAAPSAVSVADRAEALAEQRPELLVVGAFAGGLVLARLMAALGGRR